MSINENSMWQNWTDGILGLALIVVAFLGLTGATLAWTLGIFGAVIAIIAFTGVGSGTSHSRV